MKRLFTFYMIALVLQCGLFAVAQDKIFKEYDIRGVIGREFDPEDAYDIAAAIGTVLREKDSEVRTIALGADGRIHSPAVKEQVTNALIDRGFDVVDIGSCTTPVMYFAGETLPVDAGLMITASHNPGEYNGIKIRLRKAPVFGDDIQNIRRHYADRTFLPVSSVRGTVRQTDGVAAYIDYLADAFPDLKGGDIRAVLDCGNGAAGFIIPKLIEKMQWTGIELLYADVDGTYPNHIADPSVEAYMSDLKEAVKQSLNAVVGLGFDGDGDRMAPVTKSGKLLKGDQLLTLYSAPILREHAGSAVVFDVSSSLALFEVIKKMGGVPVISATGIAQVKRNMVESDAKIGGEMSCHTIFADLGFDDGIYSMMQLFRLLRSGDKTLDELFSELPAPFSSPLYRIPCAREKSLAIVEKLKEHFSGLPDCECITVDGLRVHFSRGWAIVRASNTEPVISIRFEGNAETDLTQIKDDFTRLLAGDLDCSKFAE